jgi:adenine phosphoribosyltransferase
MNIIDHIRIVQNFPTSGINFFDVTSILEKPDVFSFTLRKMEHTAVLHQIESIVAIDARGFIWASALADRLKTPLFLARKPGKLPGEIVTKEYQTEYSTASLSMIKNQQINGPVLVVDDILATGGTLNAVGNLLTTHWNIRPENQIHSVLVDLSFLPGRKLLEEQGYCVCSLVKA